MGKIYTYRNATFFADLSFSREEENKLNAAGFSITGLRGFARESFTSVRQFVICKYADEEYESLYYVFSEWTNGGILNQESFLEEWCFLSLQRALKWIEGKRAGVHEQLTLW